MQGITASREKKILQEKSSKKNTPPSSTASWFSVLDSCSCGLSRPVGEPTKHSPFNIHFIEQHYRPLYVLSLNPVKALQQALFGKNSDVATYSVHEVLTQQHEGL